LGSHGVLCPNARIFAKTDIRNPLPDVSIFFFYYSLPAFSIYTSQPQPQPPSNGNDTLRHPSIAGKRSAGTTRPIRQPERMPKWARAFSAHRSIINEGISPFRLDNPLRIPYR
jgi:hypothetical protein